jgi:hypothetical protein
MGNSDTKSPVVNVPGANETTRGAMGKGERKEKKKDGYSTK